MSDLAITRILAGAVFSALCLAGAAAVYGQGDANGDAPGSLYAPVDLEVIDTEATVAIVLKAGQRPPVVVVHDAAVAGRVTAAFEDVFTRTHRVFMERMRAAFGASELDAAVAAGAAFRDFRNEFQSTNPLFPVSPALGQTWARGFEAEPVRERIVALLRMIERDQLIGELRPSSTVFVVSAGAGAQARSWGEVAPHVRSVDPAEITSLATAGERLRRMNDPLDRAANGFLSGLLRANVTEDAYLTGLLLRERMGADVVARLIARGDKLAEGGAPLDRWAALALGQLRRIGVEPLTTPLPVVAEGLAAEPDPSAGENAGSPARAWIWWVGGSVLLLAGGVVAALTVAIVRRQRSSALQVVEGSATPSGATEAIIPHLARELKDRVVRALFTQRSVLLANEQAASRRVQEMEERLARLQPAIAERIRGYEQRIEALEKEIAERDVETRELIRAKLVLARKELEAEISRSRIDWN